MLQTETPTTHRNTINPRTALAVKIKKFIDHCHIISEHTNGTKRWEVLNGLDTLKKTLYPMVKRSDNHTMKDICQFTLLSIQYLRNILPVLTNNSHQSSIQTLEEIISECKSHLQKQTA